MPAARALRFRTIRLASCGCAAAVLLVVLAIACEKAKKDDCASPMRSSANYNDSDDSNGNPVDEAKKAGLTVDYFRPPSHRSLFFQDYFSKMDTVSLATNAGKADESAATYPDQLLDKNLPASRPVRVATTLSLSDSEILGRNTWMMWCGGNEAFWDWLAGHSYGFMDFLKLVDSRKRTTRWRDAGMTNEPGMRESAKPKCDEFGLWLDEPDDAVLLQERNRALKTIFAEIERTPYGTHATTQPGDYVPGYYNGYYKLYQPADPEAHVRTALDPRMPPPAIYGFSAGVIGLRLFPNPKFRGTARQEWDAEKYYNDPNYANRKDLVRPFRIGMSCAFCHVSMHPLRPPLDPVRPQWDNISGIIGAQYLRTRAVVGGLLSRDNLVYHILDSQPPGTIDTSLVASDNINNPNAMNAIFGVPARVARSFETPREIAVNKASTRPTLWRDPDTALRSMPQQIKDAVAAAANADGVGDPNVPFRHVPHILFDGSDSVGAWTALARVYLNIGTYHEKWVRLHDPLIGISPPPDASAQDRKDRRTQLPFRIADCDASSVYWLATEQMRVEPLRDYFMRITAPMPLLDAQGTAPATQPVCNTIAQANDRVHPCSSQSAKMLTEAERRVDISKLALGRKVFAHNCIVCHSSIQPESNFTNGNTELQSAHAAIAQQRRAAMKRWEDGQEPWDHDPGQWLRDPNYRAWAEWVVEQPDFWRNNFLSSDMRVPVPYVGTNSGRALATNAINGHMWEDFASKTQRELHSVGAISFFNPFTQKDEIFEPKHRVQDGAPPGGGGPGFYRPASLISIWATAPFLHNNSLGHFNNDPSLKGRMEAFDDAIHKLLYKERRLESSDYATADQLAHDHGLIWRTPCETYVTIPAGSVPLALERLPFSRTLNSITDFVTRFGKPSVVPLVLLAVGFLLLVYLRGPSRKTRVLRYATYGAMCLGLLLGFVGYLNTGRLGGLRIGPIPAGTPVNLLANINPEAEQHQFTKALIGAINGLTEINLRHLQGEDKDHVLNERVAPALLSISKCPDFVMDKGHFYPWFNEMTPEEKEALIELLKTF